MRDGGAGTCKNIRECKSFLDGLRHRTVSPGDRVHCSFLVIFFICLNLFCVTGMKGEN